MLALYTLGAGQMSKGSFVEFAVAGEATPEILSKSHVDYLEQQKALLEKQLKLEEKLLDWANLAVPNGKSDHVNTIQGYTSANDQKAKVTNLKTKIAAVDNQILSARGLGEEAQNKLVRDYSGMDLNSVRCRLGDCLENLETILRLGREIALVNEEVLVKRVSNWKSETERHGRSEGLELAIANLNLVRIAFDCERATAELRYDSWIQPKGISNCFYSIIKEEESAVGPVNLKVRKNPFFLFNSGLSLSNPQISITDYWTGNENALSDFVFSRPGYSVGPADVFRKSYQLAKGNMYVTLRTAYNALRYHRTDLDFQRKLIDLRGDRPDGGRNGGDWYHFFGTMLAELLFGTKLAENQINFDTPGGGEKKSFTNLAGVRAMSQIEEMVKAEKSPEGHPNEACQLTNLFSGKPSR